MNPYETPQDSVAPSENEETVAKTVGKPATGIRETINQSSGLTWLMVVTTMFGTLFLFLISSVIAVGIAMVVVNGGQMPTAFDEQTLGDLMKSRAGFAITIVLPQTSLIVLPILACFFLPAGPRKALRLVRGNWPWWGWAGAAIATPLVGTMASLILGPLVQESESLKSMSDAFRHHGNSGFLIPIALLIGITPSISEEILFRGFLQPRLTRLLPPSVGIFLASAAFAALHLDPVHVLGVLPLGMWLGFLSYKSGSLFPAMLGHFVNNFFSVVASMPEDSDAFDLPSTQMMLALIFFGAAGVFGVLLAIRRTRNTYLPDVRG